MAKRTKKVSSGPANLVVGVGASAGGVNAIRKLLQNLGKPKGIAFIVVQHLDESGGSLAHEVLSRQTELKVVEIKDGEALRGGVLYHAPPHKLVSLKEGNFKVESPSSRADQFTLIDFLFLSIARSQRERAVGIILSGEGTDGGQGVKAIGDAGGMTLAQIPESADFPSMPESAVATGAVDHALVPEEMADEIISYAASLAKILKSDHAEIIGKEITSALVEICEILHKATRHDFKHYKTSTLVRRIQRRMQVLQLEAVHAYVDKLRLDPKEVEALFKELLINVTCFFRDREAFETLKAEVLAPALKNQKPDQKYRIWSAGCSTGEEVYTLAILVREVLAELPHPPEVQIIATDIDEQALNLARKGSYPVTIAEDVSPRRLKKYFEKKNGRYVVSKTLREIVLFSSHNLINDPPFSQLDLISCRNLLIYLGPHLQKKLIPVFHYALRAGGHLFLGTSESMTGHKELFRTVSVKHRIAMRKATAIRPPGFATSVTHSFVAQQVESTRSHEADLHMVGQRIVLDEFAPKYAIVNDECQIVSVSGGIDQYLGPSEGTFHNNLMKLVKPSLRVGLRSAFNEAKKQKRKVTHQDSTLKLENELARIGITVQPMPQLGDETGLFMVVFHYFGFIRPKEARTKMNEALHLDTVVVEELERELVTLRKDLDRSVQDLEASNEELKSSNEELLSMNEELQSANEELESSKEDVQNANEALQRNNNDLENLLVSTEIATLFLDDEKKIQSFTPQLETIYNITKVDVGRPIAHITSLTKKPIKFPSTREVVERGSALEEDMELLDGRWIMLRISPYKTSEGTYSGIVATFIDVTHIRATEELRRESEARFQIMANSAPVLVWMASPDRRLSWVNKGWLEWTGRSMEQEICNGWIEGIHPEDVETCRKQYVEGCNRREEFYFEFRLLHNDGTFRWLSNRGVPRFTPNGSFEGYIGGCMDIHEQKLAQQKIAENEERLKTMIRTSPSFMCILSSPDYKFEEVNDKFLQLVGRKNIVGQTVLEALPEVKDQVFIKLLDQVRLSGKPFIGTEIPIFIERKATGIVEQRYLDFVYQPDLSGGDTVRSIFFHGNDVTEKVQVRQAIQDAKDSIENERENFRNLFRQTPEMVCILGGPEHIFEFVNDAHIKTLGFDATGMSVFEAQPESIEIHGILNDVYNTGETAELFEIPVTVTNKLRYFNLTYSARRETDGKISGVMILGTEITTEVSSRIELWQAKEDAERARLSAESANESKTRFLANMSHEIRTPLAAILGFSELLKGRTMEGDLEAASQLDRVVRNATQLGKLIDSLLDLSKIEASKFDIESITFDLSVAMEDVLSSVGLAARQKGLEFERHFKGKVPQFINTDPTLFRQILINVIGNAVKFTEKGRVDVEFEQYSIENKDYLQIRIQDTGIGLALEHQTKVFEPFTQADQSVTRKYGGTGLGLVLSRHLARLLGGDLILETSSPNEGSTFLVKIEIHHVDLAKASVPPLLQVSDKTLLADKKFLVVDDSPDNQIIIRLFIESAGGIVEIANNGLEGVEKMLQTHYHVVLMDIQMPIMDGYQALKVATEQGYEGKIMALTAHAMKEERDRCLAAGFVDYMTKPIERPLLIRKLSEMVALV